MTAAILCVAGKIRLNHGILKNIKENFNNTMAIDQESAQNKVAVYSLMILDLATIFPLNLDPAIWTVMQLKTILKPLQIKDGADIPTQNADLYVRWLE